MTLEKFEQIRLTTIIVVYIALVLLQGFGGYFCATEFIYPKMAEQPLNAEQAFNLGGTMMTLFFIVCVLIDWGVSSLFTWAFEKKLKKLRDEEWERTHTSILREFGSKCPCAGVVSQERCKTCGFFNGMFGGDVKCGNLEIINKID